jgi:hypothetical protein
VEVCICVLLDVRKEVNDEEEPGENSWAGNISREKLNQDRCKGGAGADGQV